MLTDASIRTSPSITSSSQPDASAPLPHLRFVSSCYVLGSIFGEGLLAAKMGAEPSTPPNSRAIQPSDIESLNDLGNVDENGEKGFTTQSVVLS